MNSNIPPLAPGFSNAIPTYLHDLKKAIEDGGTNPHIILRQIIAKAYEAGHHEGYVACTVDRADAQANA